MKNIHIAIIFTRYDKVLKITKNFEEDSFRSLAGKDFHFQIFSGKEKEGLKIIWIKAFDRYLNILWSIIYFILASDISKLQEAIEKINATLIQKKFCTFVFSQCEILDLKKEIRFLNPTGAYIENAIPELLKSWLERHLRDLVEKEILNSFVILTIFQKILFGRKLIEKIAKFIFLPLFLGIHLFSHSYRGEKALVSLVQNLLNSEIRKNFLDKWLHFKQNLLLVYTVIITIITAIVMNWSNKPIVLQNFLIKTMIGIHVFFWIVHLIMSIAKFVNYRM